jgi:nucleotide-binding universal stress UspA family protein
MRRPALWDDRRSSPRTVVVGYDGSPAARRAVLCAADAARPGGRVVVVTAASRADAEPLRLLEEAAAQVAGRGVRVSAHVGKGDPADALAQVARETRAELIVVTPSR